MRWWQVQKEETRCLNCGACRELVACPGEEDCLGCGACVSACPNRALSLVPRKGQGEITLEIDGLPFSMPQGITVLEALSLAGYRISHFPERGTIFAPCRTGGCFSCAVEIEGELHPACLTAIGEGMKVKTCFQADPLRLVQGFMGHTVGGSGYSLSP